MYKLYWSAGSGAFAVETTLLEAAAEYERIEIDLDRDEHTAPAFLAVNPRGQVPVLVLPDQTVVTETAAMVLHIADIHPWANLLPPPGDPDRARAYRWLMFAVSNFYETDLRFTYPERFTDEPGCAESVRRKAIDEFDRGWDIAEATTRPGPYLLGELFCVTDLYFTMVAHWHPESTRLFERCPRIAGLCDAVRARPAVKQIWNQHFGP